MCQRRVWMDLLHKCCSSLEDVFCCGGHKRCVTMRAVVIFQNKSSKLRLRDWDQTGPLRLTVLCYKESSCCRSHLNTQREENLMLQR